MGTRVDIEDAIASLENRLHDGVETIERINDGVVLATGDAQARVRVDRCTDTGLPKYRVQFRRDRRVVSQGNTLIADQVATAVEIWLATTSEAALHDQFVWIDRRDRRTAALRADLLRTRPELEKFAAQSDLWRSPGGERTTRFTWRQNGVVLLFDFEGTTLFEVKDKGGVHLAGIIAEWVGQEAMPSEIQRIHPAVRMTPVARFFEQGEMVPGEFVTSWDGVLDLYRRRASLWPAIELVEAMRRDGYDRQLRAGTSLAMLILSRSRRHGLRTDQPSIRFDFLGSLVPERKSEEHVDIYIRTPSSYDEIVSHPLRMSDQLRDSLDWLAAHEID